MRDKSLLRLCKIFISVKQRWIMSWAGTANPRHLLAYIHCQTPLISRCSSALSLSLDRRPQRIDSFTYWLHACIYHSWSVSPTSHRGNHPLENPPVVTLSHDRSILFTASANCWIISTISGLGRFLRCPRLVAAEDIELVEAGKPSSLACSMRRATRSVNEFLLQLEPGLSRTVAYPPQPTIICSGVCQCFLNTSPFFAAISAEQFCWRLSATELSPRGAVALWSDRSHLDLGRKGAKLWCQGLY
jgi:hypothetical protein